MYKWSRCFVSHSNVLALFWNCQICQKLRQKARALTGSILVSVTDLDHGYTKQRERMDSLNLFNDT